ncbi:hypothetical protein H0W26_05825 [Candidatus Dependentiae bacterium]|nr:hypothetical protein [Candidatus Dependentiae bacterium]
MNSSVWRRATYLIAGLLLLSVKPVSAMEKVMPFIASIKEMFFAERPKTELDKLFPLNDIGGAESFAEIFGYAYEGNLDLIRKFCETHHGFKDHVDEEGFTLTTFAATGYIEGNDSWSTFVYLLNTEVPLIGRRITLVEFQKTLAKIQNGFITVQEQLSNVALDKGELPDLLAAAQQALAKTVVLFSEGEKQLVEAQRPFTSGRDPLAAPEKAFVSALIAYGNVQKALGEEQERLVQIGNKFTTGQLAFIETLNKLIATPLAEVNQALATLTKEKEGVFDTTQALRKGFNEWLRSPLKDQEKEVEDEELDPQQKKQLLREKDARRKQVLKVLLEQRVFEPSEEEPFYSPPSTPPSMHVEQEGPSWTSSIIKVGLMSLVGAYVGAKVQSGAGITKNFL